MGYRDSKTSLRGYSGLFFTLGILVCSNGLCHAQGAKLDNPIYVVDMQKIIDSSVIGKAARSNIEEEMKKKRLVLEKSKIELDKMRADIEKQTALLSKDALAAKQEQYLRKQRDFERVYADLRDELARKNQEAMTKVVKQIDDTVKTMAESRNYRMVLEKDGRSVAYVNETFDISDQVIAAMNDSAIGVN